MSNKIEVGFIVGSAKEISTLIPLAVVKFKNEEEVYKQIDLNISSKTKVLSKIIKKNNIEKDIIYKYVGGYTLTLEGELYRVNTTDISYMITVSDEENCILYTVKRKDINKILKKDCKCLIEDFKNIFKK